MSAATITPVLKPTATGYRLWSPLVFAVRPGETETVPGGFDTDGASVPRPLWPLVLSPYDPRAIRAAVIHDFMYRFGAWPRAQADDVLLAYMRADGVPAFTARVVWAAVRLFGWLYWRRLRYNRGL